MKQILEQVANAMLVIWAIIVLLILITDNPVDFKWTTEHPIAAAYVLYSVIIGLPLMSLIVHKLTHKK